MENDDYAAALEEIAALHRVAGDNRFKVRSFERASRAVRDLAEPIDDLLERHRVEEIEGIGESVAAELRSLYETGVSPRLLELRERVDPAVLEWLELPWLGTRRVQALYRDLGARTLGDIRELAESGALAAHDAFGESAAEKILHEIERFERVGNRRIPLPEAKTFADSLCYQFLELDEVTDCAPGGSIRRGQETVGDIDLAIGSDDPAAVVDYFRTLPEVIDVKYEGGSRASAILTSEIKVDIWIEPPDVFGANLFFVTGPTDHHIALREKVKKKGLKMREYGVVRRDDPEQKVIGPMKTEEDVYRSIGLAYIPPEIRGAGRDIKLAERHEIPELVDAASLRGDCHVHTPATDEADEPLAALVRKARARNYEWLCVTDRCTRSGDDGCSADELRSRLETLRELDESLEDFDLIAGVEVEILADGTLDIEHRLLTECDWVVGTITRDDAKMTSDEMTQRIVWAIETGLLSSLAHPSGRRLGHDDGRDFDFDAVIEACIDFGVALEMSGDPARLDLNASRAARAHSRGALLALGSNASSVGALDNIDYAITQARRAWLEDHHVLNTLSAGELVSSVRALIA